MVKARYKNKAGWTFIAWDENPYVEIFRPVDLKTKLTDAIPYEVWYIGNASPTEATLKKIANETSDYAKMV